MTQHDRDLYDQLMGFTPGWRSKLAELIALGKSAELRQPRRIKIYGSYRRDPSTTQKEQK
jgi:hypothetical protein